jgi:ribosomal protein L37AE/L43A
MGKMNIENTMVTGYGKPDRQYYQPIRYKCPDHYDCPRCGIELGLKHKTYEWDDMWLCGECFADAILSLSAYERTELTGETDIDRVIEDANGDPDALAALFDVTTKKAEEVA